MVQFVKPNLLGTYKEYLNRFVNPITNGQYTDSTENDISVMRRRSHVLHKMLDGIVQRRDYCVLAPFLPPKYEYVLFIRLTKIQVELYKEYLSKFARQKQSGKGMSFLFQDFQELQRICIHPRVLLDKSQAVSFNLVVTNYGISRDLVQFIYLSIFIYYVIEIHMSFIVARINWEEKKMRMMKKVLLRISLMMVQKNQQPVKKVHQIATVMLQSRVILKLIGEKQEPIPEMVSHKKELF